MESLLKEFCKERPSSSIGIAVVLGDNNVQIIAWEEKLGIAIILGDNIVQVIALEEKFYSSGIIITLEGLTYQSFFPTW